MSLLRRPVHGHTWSTHLFFRLLGVVYLLAFASLAPQILGLSGEHGILPASWALKWAQQNTPAAPLLHPSLFWLDAHDATLLATVGAGCLLAILAVLGIAPPLVFGLLWFLYLSIVNIGDRFFWLQWDMLLLETGFLALLAAPRRWFQPWNRPQPPALWFLVLLGWLLFRLMFFSGWVKLASGDTAWSSLSALEYHFETQPLPTPLAWHAHQLSAPVLAAAVMAMFAIELVLPFALAGPRLLRRTACGAFLALQAGIALTGNYGFFNLLASALVLPLLDDACLPVVRTRHPPAPLPPAQTFPPSGRAALACGAAVFLLTLPVPLMQTGLCPAARALWEPLRGWHLTSGYGLFAVMTRERPELVIEGSQDGLEWKPYRFRWKPTDADSTPSWTAPHMPRLDWQLWFAALGAPEDSPWVRRLLQQIRHESQPVLSLLADNPFPQAPPRWLRVRRVLFNFATPERKHSIGHVWFPRSDELYMLETPPPAPE
jgi:hypothetical protein